MFGEGYSFERVYFNKLCDMQRVEVWRRRICLRILKRQVKEKATKNLILYWVEGPKALLASLTGEFPG